MALEVESWKNGGAVFKGLSEIGFQSYFNAGHIEKPKSGGVGGFEELF